MAKKKSLTPDERRRIADQVREIQREIRELIELLQARLEKRPT